MAAELSHAEANLVAARALAAALSAAPGAPPRAVVVSPGSRSAPLVLALSQTEGIELHVVLDERSAGFVALGLSRAEGRAAALVCTSGSAGGHYLPAVIEAFEAEVPLVLVTADRPAELQDIGAPQSTAQTQLYGRHVRGAFVLPTPRAGVVLAEAHSRIATQALALAQGIEAGPVHINAPFAEPLVPPPGDVARARAHPLPVPMRWHPPGAARLSDAAVRELAARLADTEGGIVACGPLLGRPAPPELGVLLGKLARRLGWPLWLDGCSQLRHKTASVPYDVILGAPAASRLPRSAMSVRLGHALTSKRGNQHLAPAQQGERPRGVCISASGRLRDPFGQLGEMLVAAPEVAIARLLDALGDAAPAGQPAGDALALWQRADQAVRNNLATLGTDDAPLWEGAAMVAAVRGLAPATRLQLGSSLAVRDFDALVPSAAFDVACNRGVNGIDGTLSSAIGLALAAPRRPVAAIVGELTFLHDVAALQAARQLGVALLVVIVNNHGGGIFRGLPIAAYDAVFERYFLTAQQADIAALCSAMGATHVAVKSGPALGAAVRAAQQTLGGVHVVEVACAHDAAKRRARWLSTCYEQLETIVDGAVI